MDEQRISKYLSYVLRHAPEAAGLTLDESGWVAVEELIDGCRRQGKKLTRPLLEAIVAEDAKGRYSFSDDGTRIRANQGHSIDVDLKLEPAVPPDVLYQGTVVRFLAPIREEGLRPMNRHHVHLTADFDTAVAVGKRRGKPIVLTIDAQRMHADGHPFYRSTNDVWLVDRVPPEYIDFPDDEG